VLGVAIQGAGNVSTEHIRAYQRNPHTQVVAIGSRREEGARAKAAQMGLECALYTDYEALLAHPGVDIVSICTPHDRHALETIAAARAGKHLLIEKPVAVDLGELREMADAVRSAGVKSVVSFVPRWNPLVLTLKELLGRGALGSLFYAEVDYLHGTWHRKRPGPPLRGGAPLSYEQPRDRPLRTPISTFLGGGCHAVDMARYLMGADVVEVTALSPADEVGKDRPPRTTVALVRFAGGAIGKIGGASRQKMPYVFNIALYGETGSVRNNRVYSDLFPGQTDFVEIPTILPDSGDVAHHPFPEEIDHLVECILNDRESHCNLADAVNTHEVCFAADRSAAAGGAPLRLPLNG
jgi:predicted dehydrogenase